MSVLAGCREGNAATQIAQLTSKPSYCDQNLVDFPSFRNGISLGTAFDNITRGVGMAYFPAISLSFKESVAFNFGSRPLRYPLGVGRGGLKGEEPVLKPSLEAVEYTYVTADCFLLFVLGRRAGSRREPPGQNHWAHKHQCWSLGVSEMRRTSSLQQQLLLQRGLPVPRHSGPAKISPSGFGNPNAAVLLLATGLFCLPAIWDL